MYYLVAMIPRNEHAAFLLHVLKRTSSDDFLTSSKRIHTEEEKLEELGLPPGWMVGHYKRPGGHFGQNNGLVQYYYREEDGEEIESYEDLHVPWVLHSVSLQGEARSTLWWNREWEEEEKDLEKSAKKPKLDQASPAAPNKFTSEFEMLTDLGNLVVEVLREAGIQGNLDAQTCNEHIDSLQEQLYPYVFTHDGTVQDYIVALDANRALTTKKQRRAYGTALTILGAVCCGHLLETKADNLRKNHTEEFFFEHLRPVVAQLYNLDSSSVSGPLFHEAKWSIECLEVALNRREPRPLGQKG